MIQRLSLFLIFVFLPTQLGLHFWGSFTQVGGFRLDYLSPTLYFTDLLITSYLILSLGKILSYLRNNLPHILPLVILVFLNILFSLSPIATAFLWARWILYLLLVLSLSLNRVKVKDIILPLTISSIFVVLLELFQILSQSSIGGLFNYLGERAFNQSTPQVAKLISAGRVYIRPYATFSHPNSLAGYLLLVLFLLRSRLSPIIYRLTIIIGILLTFSKTVIFTSILYLLGIFRKNIIWLIMFIPLLLFFFPSVIGLSDSLSNRQYLLTPTLNIILDYPIFGTGLGGYFSALTSHLQENQVTPSLIQPVHNITLLFLSELGIAGVICLIFYARKLTFRPGLIEMISLVLLTGGFDHYWLTLPQNKLLLLLALWSTIRSND